MKRIRCTHTISGGKSSGMCPWDFPTAALEKGARVEREHTDDPRLAQEIAMDHLVEDHFYYDKLATIHSEHTPNRGRLRIVDAYDAAARMRETFTDKPVSKETPFRWKWPKVWQHVGDSLAVAYESDKWKKDGSFESYKHLAESRNRAFALPSLIHRYDDASRKWPVIGPRYTLAGVPMPKQFAELGLFIEADLRLHTAGTSEHPSFSKTKDDGCVKLTIGHALLGGSVIRWSVDGGEDEPFLFVYTEKEGVYLLIFGDDLHIEKDGIAG